MKYILSFVLLLSSAFAQTVAPTTQGPVCGVYNHVPTTYTCLAYLPDGGSIAISNFSAGNFGPGNPLPGWVLSFNRYSAGGTLLWSKTVTGNYSNNSVTASFDGGSFATAVQMKQVCAGRYGCHMAPQFGAGTLTEN